MQAVPCRIRSFVNKLSLNLGTFIMRTMADNTVSNHVYNVHVFKMHAITYMDGEEWKQFVYDYGLQRGDEVRLEVIGSTVFATAAMRDPSSNFFCTHHIL